MKSTWRPNESLKLPGTGLILWVDAPARQGTPGGPERYRWSVRRGIRNLASGVSVSVGLAKLAALVAVNQLLRQDLEFLAAEDHTK